MVYEENSSKWYFHLDMKMFVERVFDFYLRAYCFMFLNSIMLSQKKNPFGIWYKVVVWNVSSRLPHSHLPLTLHLHILRVKLEEASMKQTTTTRFSGH